MHLQRGLALAFLLKPSPKLSFQLQQLNWLSPNQTLVGTSQAWNRHPGSESAGAEHPPAQQRRGSYWSIPVARAARTAQRAHPNPPL